MIIERENRNLHMKTRCRLSNFVLGFAETFVICAEPYTDPKDNTCQYSIHTLLQRFGMW